jgi:hypothetical protein
VPGVLTKVGDVGGAGVIHPQGRLGLVVAAAVPLVVAWVRPCN